MPEASTWEQVIGEQRQVILTSLHLRGMALTGLQGVGQLSKGQLT